MAAKIETLTFPGGEYLKLFVVIGEFFVN